MPADVPIDEAPALSLCVPEDAPFASEPLAVVDDASPCEPDTISGVCDSIMAVWEAEGSAPLAVGLPVVSGVASLPASFAAGLPAVFGEASLSASFGIGLPAEPDEAWFCVPADNPGVCDSVAAVAGARFSASWPDACSEAAEYESCDPWLGSGSIFEAAVGAGVV
jgi:hypothetical protein